MIKLAISICGNKLVMILLFQLLHKRRLVCLSRFAVTSDPLFNLKVIMLLHNLLSEHLI